MGRTKSEYLRAAISALGGSCDNLPDNLESTLYKRLIETCACSGGASNLTWDDLGRGEVETPIWSLTAEFISAGSQSFTNAEKEWVSVTVGQTYRVTYDGEKYDIVAKYSAGQYLGDLKLEQAYPEGLEYPFLIRFDRNKVTVQVLTTTPGMHTLTIATVEEGIIPIPEEYLPQGAGGGGSMEPIVIFINDEPMTASITFEEAWALSVPDLAARLTACGSHDDDGTEIGIGVVAVQKNNTRTWGKHIIVRFDYMEAASDHVLVEPGYILWTESDSFYFMPAGMP